MKLFGIHFGGTKPAPPRITGPDREWVEGCFRGLLKLYGFPRVDQRMLNAACFPRTFAVPELRVENLIADCCTHLGLNEQAFSYEVYEDLRDLPNVPYAIAGTPIDCQLHANEQNDTYTIACAKSIFKRPGWLISAVCYEFAKARLLHDKLAFAADSNTKPFVYLAAVFLGYGGVVAQHLTQVGRSSDGLWETQWAYASAIPLPVMAYALALFAKLKNDLQPQWREILPGELQKEFDACAAYLRSAGTAVFDEQQIENEATAHALYKQAFQLYQAGNIGEAVSCLQQTLVLTADVNLNAHALHNIGYYKTRLGDYAGGISALRSCLALKPAYRYGHDNLGFALIMTGDLEAGKEHLDQALQSGENNEAYTFRNLALYHQKKQEFALAEAYFNKSFEANTPVDLLDFFYGQYLLETGQQAQGLEHLRAAARLGEHEAVARLRELAGPSEQA